MAENYSFWQNNIFWPRGKKTLNALLSAPHRGKDDFEM